MNETDRGEAREANGDGMALRRALRSRTQASHERLDGLFEGMTRAETPADYHRFVRINEACHRRIEPILSASGLWSCVPGWRPADRSRSLAADLRSMGLPPLPDRPFAMPKPDPVEAIGIAYVLEGSRLGARYILAALRARPPTAAWSGASFHYLAGPDEPHALRHLLIEASRSVSDDADVARCVDAANATFDHFLATHALAAEAA